MQLLARRGRQREARANLDGVGRQVFGAEGGSTLLTRVGGLGRALGARGAGRGGGAERPAGRGAVAGAASRVGLPRPRAALRPCLE